MAAASMFRALLLIAPLSHALSVAKLGSSGDATLRVGREEGHRLRVASSASEALLLRGLHRGFERSPVAFLEDAARVLNVQKAMVAARNSADNVKKQEAERKRLALLRLVASSSDTPCGWRTRSGSLEEQPKYPFEHLLDVDYIYDADNYLETWMNETYGPLAGVPDPDEIGKQETTAAPARSTAVPEQTTVAPEGTTGAAPEQAPSPVAFASGCSTHEDPRLIRRLQLLLRSRPAPAGTACLFGVTPEDEGSHCVFSGGKYGSFGWCYTREDKRQWGSCAEECPTSGHTQILSLKIERLSEKIQGILARMHQEVDGTGAAQESANGTEAAHENAKKAGTAQENANGTEAAHEDAKKAGAAKEKVNGTALFQTADTDSEIRDLLERSGDVVNQLQRDLARTSEGDRAQEGAAREAEKAVARISAQLGELEEAEKSA